MLTFLRRLLLTLLALALMALIAVVFLNPEALVTAGQSIASVSFGIRLVLVVVAAFIIFLVLLTQTRPAHRLTEDGLVVRASGAIADVSTESASARILKVVRDVPNVIHADGRLESINGKADLDLDVVVSGENVNVPGKQKEINRALRQVIQKQLGLQLASQPRVHIRLLSPDQSLPQATAATLETHAIIPPPPTGIPVEGVSPAPTVMTVPDAPRQPEPVAQQPATAPIDWVPVREARAPEAPPVEIEAEAAQSPLESPEPPAYVIPLGSADRPTDAVPLDPDMLRDFDPDLENSFGEDSSDEPSTGLYDEDDEGRGDGKPAPPPASDL